MAENEKSKIKVCLFSDFDFRSSGYFNISVACAKGLSELGNYDVKCVGLGYNGEEHTFPFSIIPAKDLQESFALIFNLKKVWEFDILLVALDIPVQEQVFSFLQRQSIDTRYIGIMPIEADPLCPSWALLLMQMDRPFIISEFGSKEAHRVGVNAEYFPVGIDTESWRKPTEEERTKLRSALGFSEDDFVVLTVAYNQERKFLSRGIEIFSDFVYGQQDIEELLAVDSSLEPVVNAKYVMVTAEHSPVGWRLRDLAQEFGISDRFIIVERGVDHLRLWSTYAACDAFLLPSKAEGFGMILLEAMSMGLPCIGTNCTGIKDLLGDGRGKLIPVDYSIRDPFGNGRRYYPSREKGTELLKEVYSGDNTEMIDKATEYVKSRTWEKAVEVLSNTIEEILNGEA